MDVFDMENARLADLQSLKTRLTYLCVAGDESTKHHANEILRGKTGKELVRVLLLDKVLVGKALEQGFDLAAPYGSFGQLMVTLVEEPSRDGLLRLTNLLECGGDANASHPQTGRTPLMQAVRKWSAFNRDRVDRLLKHGADPERQDFAGKSAFDYAPMQMVKYIQHRLNVMAEPPVGPQKESA